MCEEISNSVVRLCSIVTAARGRSIMKSNLLHRYKLEKKIAKLERLVTERSVGRGGGPSKAYQIWDYLMNNGPKSVSDLKSALPKDITNFINFYADNNLLIKDGDMISANADYKWDDVGVIPKTAQQEMINSLRDGGIPDATGIPEEQPTRSARAPRQRAVKQNLFSRKFDEVKAAVDAGQDVNQTNDKSQTPLLFAANSKAGNNSDIIEYLLTHGANLNSEFKGLNAFDLVCKNDNIDAMRVILANDTQNVINNPSSNIKWYYKNVPDNKDIILLAASKERYEFNQGVHRFYYTAYARKIISKEQYEQIINNILNSCKFGGYSFDVIEYEVSHEILNTIKKIADKEKILVRLNWAVSNNDISPSIARQLLDLCGKVVDGKLSIQWGALDFIETCRILCKRAKDQSFMSNLLSQAFLSNLSDSDIRSLFRDAVESNDVNTLSKLVAAKVKLGANTVCDNRYLQDANEEITRLATRLIDRNTQLNRFTISDVAECENEYLINYVIDMGYGEDLLAWCIDNRYTDNEFAVIKVLKENGFEVPDDSDSRRNIVAGAENRRNSKIAISKIVDAIENDEWSRELEAFVANHPEILLDSSIAKAIEDNNTTTSRQLRRRAERVPKDQDIYDL